MTTIYDTGLAKNRANYVPLSPLSFLSRAARVFPEHPAIIHGQTRRSWSETEQRCRRLASALTRRGIGHGDTVAVIAPNIPELFETHFGVPMTGAVLNALNIRLDAASLAYILDHGEAKVLLTDTEFAPVIQDALHQCKSNPLVIDIDDPEGPSGERLGSISYDEFLTEGQPDYVANFPNDEWDAISLNYTSGTTGDPKGVVYHHRGAYLNSLSNLVGWDMGHHPIYLWTLPMFHCNGWCFPWSLGAVAGTSVCMRKVDAANIYSAIAEHGITHFCAAPIVLNFVVNASPEEKRPLPHTVRVMTAAAPPPTAVLTAMEEAGFSVTHVYGLTETYGPAVICAWHPEWDQLPLEEQAKIKSRQGVPYHALEELQILNSKTLEPVAADGATLGEAMFRGNVVMKGYLKDTKATEKAFLGGWFHSGDLGVTHVDSYIQLKDRSKDIIISGGENISSIEIEDVLYKHPAVLEAAVVARPDNKWGETPCAFVTLKPSINQVNEQALIEFCRNNMARYKSPKTIIFGALPKTSTGKVQKFKLRQQANALGSL
jgi:fatty-acyl-CoA synthase